MSDEKKISEAIAERLDYYDKKTSDAEIDGKEDLAGMWRNHGSAMYEALEIARRYENDAP